MPYASGRVIHDADAHIMELPGFLDDHLEAKYRGRVDRRRAVPAARGLSQPSQGGRARGGRTSTKARSCSPRTGPRSALPPRHDRPRSIDLLGFASQLMFTTALLNYSVGARRRHGPRPHLRRGARPYAAHGRVLLGRPAPAADRLRAAGRLRAHRQGGARGDRARRQGADDPLALPRRPFAEPHRLRSAVGDRPGSRPADRFPCRRRRQAAGGRLLQQRPAAGAGLPRRRRQFQVDRLHGDRLSADEGADGADRRPRARPLPQAEVRRHRAGRVVGAGLDAQHGFARTTPSTRTRSGCRRCRSSPASSCSARCASRPTRTRMPAGSSPTRATRSACSRRTIRMSRAAAIRSSASRPRWQRPAPASAQKQRFYCDNFVDLMGAGLAPD